MRGLQAVGATLLGLRYSFGMWTVALHASLPPLLLAIVLGACSGAGDSDGLASADRPMFPSELDAVRNQITPCWDPPLVEAGGRNPSVEVRVKLLRDNTVSALEVIDSERMQSDLRFRAMAESALRAIEDCGFPRLPPDKYEIWREIVLNFDPSELVE